MLTNVPDHETVESSKFVMFCLEIAKACPGAYLPHFRIRCVYSSFFRFQRSP